MFFLPTVSPEHLIGDTFTDSHSVFLSGYKIGHENVLQIYEIF